MAQSCAPNCMSREPELSTPCGSRRPCGGARAGVRGLCAELQAAPLGSARLQARLRARLRAIGSGLGARLGSGPAGFAWAAVAMLFLLTLLQDLEGLRRLLRKGSPGGETPLGMGTHFVERWLVRPAHLLAVSPS